jgi:hypothetical protein
MEGMTQEKVSFQLAQKLASNDEEGVCGEEVELEGERDGCRSAGGR